MHWSSKQAEFDSAEVFGINEMRGFIFRLLADFLAVNFTQWY